MVIDPGSKPEISNLAKELILKSSFIRASAEFRAVSRLTDDLGENIAKIVFNLNNT